MTLACRQLSGKTHTLRSLVACKLKYMKSRFEPDRTATGDASDARVVADFIRPKLNDPEAIKPEPIEPEVTERRYVDPESLALDSYDASERHFAISLNESAAVSSRFVVEDHPEGNDISDVAARTSGGAPSVSEEVEETGGEGITMPPSKRHDSLTFFGHEPNRAELDTEVPWRQEVSARLTRYQARRRVRTPRYPSLQLKFETPETWRASPAEELRSGPAPNTSALAKSIPATNAAPLAILPSPSLESSSRIIEFPRSSTIAPNHSEELAEPVFVRPRIMEAPELVPDTPSLGGILIEPMDAPAHEKRPGFEMPLQAARMARRLAATLMDAVVVFAGLGLFGYIFSRVTASIPPIRAAAPILLVVASILWAAYQYLLLVHCGTTPGLKLAKLKLSHFDGSAVPRKMRRWRVLASVLSGLSLGLGYAWCFLDEDQLCWHDRITRTYIAPNA